MKFLLFLICRGITIRSVSLPLKDPNRTQLMLFGKWFGYKVLQSLSCFASAKKTTK